MKYLITILLLLPLAAHAQLTTVQGGTGLKGILTGSIPFGSLTAVRMATSSGLQWDNNASNLTFTYGSTTALTVSGNSYLGTVASGIWNGTAIDISSFTNLTAGDALTLTGDDLDFDGGATPSGDLGGTWASPSVTNDSHAHTGATLSGIDISDDTNLAGDTEIVLTGDSLSIASTIARDSELHSAVTVTGEDYLSLATQQITANAIDPDNLSASDFGDFTCNGTTCSLDASYQPLDSDLTDLAGLTAATGDLIYGNGTGDWAKRAATTNGFILALSGGIPTWVATTTFSSGLTYLNGNVTADLGTAITSSEITNDEIVNADINTAAAISVSKLALTAGDALTITGDDIDFDGGATPSGDLGGTWASPSVTDDSHAHTGGTISGLDISGDTNLTAGDGLTLTDDDLDCDTASGSTFGCLSAANWTTFNTKENALTFNWPLIRSTNTITFGGLSTSSPIAAESGLLYATGVNTLASVSTSSPVQMSITGNSGTATALAANGANCSSGSAPLGVDASGAVETCFDVWTEAENTSAAYTPQARTLTVAGTANQITSSAGAQDLSANRTWTLSLPSHVIFPSSFQADSATTTNATSTNHTITGNLIHPSLTSALLLTGSDGLFAEYTGTSCTNQFVRSLSALGAATCATVGTADVSGLDISDDTNLAATWPVVLTGDTLSFNGLSTSTDAVVSNLPYFSGVNTFANVATTSLALALGLSHSGTLGSLVGGSSGTLSIATSSLYTGTTGQVAYFDGTNTLTGTSSLFIAATGNVGIGTVSPDSATLLDIQDTTDAAIARLMTTSDTAANGAFLRLTHHRTGSAATQADDVLGQIFAGGIDTAARNQRMISFEADAAWGTAGDITDRPVRLVFSTTADGAAGPTERMRITGAGNVGIGATSPLGKLSVETDGASNDIFSAVYGAGFNAGLNFYSTNGTQASPTANSNGQPLGLIRFQGFDTARSSGALITATTSAEWGTAGDASDNPTDLQFFTAADGAAITAIPRMVITGSGNIGIATTTPAKLLDVFSSGTTTTRIDSSSLTQGACLVMKDRDGSGYTYLTANNGVLTASTVSCE